MEAGTNNRSTDQMPSVIDIIKDYKPCHQSEDLDLLVEKFSTHHIEDDEDDDQGICLSGSSSPIEFYCSENYNVDDDLFETLDTTGGVLADLIEQLLLDFMMDTPLDLRKNIHRRNQERDDNPSCLSDDDNNTSGAMDLTSSGAKAKWKLEEAQPPSPSFIPSAFSPRARGTPTSPTSGPPPPSLIPLSNPSLAESIKSLSLQEKDMLRQSYQRLVRFLRLDLPVGRYLEKDREVALKRLQSFLLVYLIQVKDKNLTSMFQDSFGNETGIRQFFRVLLSKSEQLTRRASLPNMPNTAPQILCRGPVGLHDRQHNRNATLNNAPYPSRRTDSVRVLSYGGPSPHGYRIVQASHPSTYYSYNASQPQGYPHPPAPMWYSNPPSYHEPLPLSQQKRQLDLQQSFPQHPHPDTRDNVPTFREDQPINVEDAIHLVLKWLPSDKDIEGLSDRDYNELYGPKQHAASPYNDSLMTPSPSGSFQSHQHSESIPGSPASPWQLTTFVGSSLTSPQYSSASNSPYSNVMSPPLSSATSSPAPASPRARSVENQMTRMTLSQPPPLIPLDKTNLPTQQEIAAATSPKQAVAPSAPLINRPLVYRSAHDEMVANLNPLDKEQSMRQVVKCTLETLTKADDDGDTLLMIACANSNYKNEDIYALIERLKCHPQPAKVFSAMNNRRESALYLAAIERRALVSGYLAETMCALNVPLNQTYEKGNTVIHYLAIWGDEFNEVLRYLVRIRTADGKPAFDLNARNHTGRSALHETVMLYIPNDSVGEGYIKNIQLLLEHGADAGLSDITSGKTPVHIAVEKRDPFLLELLLSKCPGSANAPMYNDNRPLHSAATLTEVTDVQQLELVNILLKYGADKALRNKANKLPIELVQQDRDQVKAILQARSRSNHTSN